MKHHGHEYGQNDENQIYGPAHAPRMKWTCSGCSKRNDSKLFAGCTSILLPCRHCKKVTHFLATSKGVEGERNQEPTPNPDDALEQL